MYVCCANSLQPCLTCATLWTVFHQTPLPMGFSRQEYWTGLSCPSPICMYTFVHKYMYLLIYKKNNGRDKPEPENLSTVSKPSYYFEKQPIARDPSLFLFNILYEHIAYILIPSIITLEKTKSIA